MADQAYQLVVRKGPRPGQVFPLELDSLAVGRDPLSDIVLDDPEVSRLHARMTRVEEGYALQDMGSTNGTFVDGKRLGGEPLNLKPGQVVMMGSNVTLVYQATTESDPMATMVGPSFVPEVEAAEPAAFEPDVPAAEPPEPEVVEEPEVPVAAEPEAESPVEFPVEEEEPEFVTLVEEGPFVVSEAEAEPEVEPSPVAEEPAAEMPSFEEPVFEEPAIEEPAPFPTFDEVEPGPEPEPEPPPEIEPLPGFDEPEPLPSFDQPPPVESPEPIPGPQARVTYDSGEPIPDLTPEPAVSQPPPPPVDSGKAAGADNRNRNIIIAVVVLLLLCCCLLVLIGAIAVSMGYFTVSSPANYWVALANTVASLAL